MTGHGRGALMPKRGSPLQALRVNASQSSLWPPDPGRPKLILVMALEVRHIQNIARHRRFERICESEGPEHFEKIGADLIGSKIGPIRRRFAVSWSFMHDEA